MHQTKQYSKRIKTPKKQFLEMNENLKAKDGAYSFTIRIGIDFPFMIKE